MLARKNLRYLSAQRRGNDSTGKLTEDPLPHAAAFGQRLAELVALAQTQAKLVVLLAFPIKTRVEQSPEVRASNLAQSYTFMPYLTPDDTLAWYAAYNDAIRRVAQDSGALLVATEVAIPGDEQHFWDSVHLTDAGCAVLAARVTDALEAWPGFQQLLAELEQRARGL